MINENEIRIGSCFYHKPVWSYRSPIPELVPDGFWFLWQSSDWYALNECTINLEDIEPVPLNKNILERWLGFHFTPATTKEKPEYRIYSTPNLPYDIKRFIYLRYSDSIVKIQGIEKEFKYLHELQEAWPVLFSQQLEIKL